MEKSDRLAMFVAGLGAGVAAGMLLAPYRGEEMRQRVRSGASQASGFLQENAAKLRDAADNALMQSRDGAEKSRKMMSDLTDKAKEKMGKAAEAAKTGAGKVVDKSKDLAHEAGRKVEDGGQRMQDA